MKRSIRTQTVRQHELSDRQVVCPNALDHDRQTRYGVVARTGYWITFLEHDATGGKAHTRCGRMLGRVDAPFIPDDRYPCERIDGHLSVLALADSLQHAYIRWINPADVIEVSATPPTKLLAFVTGPLPNATIVHQLSDYGTLSETYIENVPHHCKAFEAGVSPAAWDAGVRKPPTT